MVRPYAVKGRKRKKNKTERYDKEEDEEEKNQGFAEELEEDNGTQKKKLKSVATESDEDKEKAEAAAEELAGIPLNLNDQQQQGDDKNGQGVIFILEKASLEVAKVGKSYQLLNSEDHANFLKKNNRNPAEYRPDISHQSRTPQSGASEATIPFPHLEAWEVARRHPKWEPIPMVDMDGPTASRKKGSSSKRSKTSESGDYTTSTDALSCNMPSMNSNEEPGDDPDEDTPTPTRPDRKKSGESSRLGKESVAENFAEYMAAKLAEMVETKERRKEAHILKMKREETYINYLNEKQKNADLTVILQPHEHIDEPFKSILLQRKREICDKWGWEGL